MFHLVCVSCAKNISCSVCNALISLNYIAIELSASSLSFVYVFFETVLFRYLSVSLYDVIVNI